MPFIFPSLSRAPEFANTRKIEDGTIKDPMESGYVATRPRFTRLRRTFGVSYKWLTAEDVRALDFFETQVVKGMAGSFYLPSQVPNGSFEIPSSVLGQLFAGWQAFPAVASNPPAPLTAHSSPYAYDGSASLALISNGNPSVPVSGGGSASVGLVTAQTFPVAVGDVYQVSAQASNVSTPGVQTALLAVLNVTYADGTTSSPEATQIIAAGATYQAVSLSITVPAATSGSPAVSASLAIQGFLNSVVPTQTVSVASNAVALYLDCVGLALTSTAQPYGRMPGQPLVSSVRFTKQVSVKDAGWMNGAPAYDAGFEVTEL